DLLVRWRLPRGLAAPLIVLSVFAILFGFGAWMAPTLHEQGVELRRRLPESIDRMESYVNAHRNGVVGMVLSNWVPEPAADSAAPATGAATVVKVQPSQPDSGGTATSALRQRIDSRMRGASRF